LDEKTTDVGYDDNRTFQVDSEAVKARIPHFPNLSDCGNHDTKQMNLSSLRRRI
jgi:hypothetical protein